MDLDTTVGRKMSGGMELAFGIEDDAQVGILYWQSTFLLNDFS